ncbi:MAG: alpha/beta hydrolase [Gemmatimonadota bacterium]
MSHTSSSRPARALVLLALALTGVIALFMISPVLAERLLFFPDPTDPGNPPPLAGTEGRSVLLTTQDGVELHGWWWDAGEEAPTVLFFHGNAGTIAGRLATAEMMVRRGISTFHIDYRGYGRSGGEPSEVGVRRDAEAALAWLVLERGGEERIVIHGRSLGGAVAAGLAADRRVAGVVLESTFTSLAEMGGEVYPFLPSFLLRRLRGRFDTLGAVSRVRAPVLVIHGRADDLIPFRMGEALHERAPVPKAFYPVAGAGHNDLPLVGGEAYAERVAAFVRQVSTPSR